MRLGSSSRSVELTPTRYEFPEMQSSGPDWDWDVNWLMIQGEVVDGDLTWSFVDPCMTTREARELSEWLRAIASGDTPRADSWFTEPNIQFRFLEGTQEEARVAIGFAQGSAPPGSGEEVVYGEGHPIELTLRRDTFGEAADGWDCELIAFPER